MRFNLSYLLVLALLGFSLPGFSQDQITISFDKQNYLQGDIIQVNFSTSTPLAQRSWIGMFKASIAHGSHKGYVTYHYIHQQTAKTFNFIAPIETGKYEFRVFNEEYGKEVKIVPFQVDAINPDEVSIAVVSQEIRPQQPFEINVRSTFALNPKVWVGIFKSSIDENNARNYESYQYVNRKKGDILRLTAPKEIGDYELRLYATDTGPLIKRVPFRMGQPDLAGLNFTLNKEAYGPEEDVIINYLGHANLTDRAWVGFFKSDASDSYREYISYQYLRPKTGGTVTLKAPASKGQYEVRMFYADQGPQLLSAVAFSVTSSLDKDYLKKTIEAEGRVILYGIYFDTDKSSVKPSSYPLIQQIAEMLNADSSLKIRIEGHTDSQGEDGYNQSLSEKRSAAVGNLLTSKYNVSPTQLESQGYGESKPVGNNNNSSGRAKNRRVELVKI